MNLNVLRRQVDKIDEKIVRLVDERAVITNNIMICKKANKLPIEDKARERVVMGKIMNITKHPKLAKILWRNIIEYSKRRLI